MKNRIKKVFKKLYQFEKVVDYIYWKKYKFSFNNKYPNPIFGFNINFKKDLYLVFFCGMGDFLYGMPLYLELKKRLEKNNCNLIAYIAKNNSMTNNPKNYKIAKECGCFSEVKIFQGFDRGYWKYYDWSIVTFDNNKQILPFIYCTSYFEKHRVISILKQYKIKTNNLELSYPEIKLSNELLKLVKVIKQKQKVLLLHFDTRSGNYKYKYLDKLIEYLCKNNYFVITCTESDYKNKNLYNLKVNDYSIGEIISFLKQTKILTIAINSIFWPLCRFANNKLIALHYLKSKDGHQFYYDNMIFVSPEKKCIEKIGKGILVEENIHYEIYKKNSYMIEYKPEYILGLLREIESSCLEIK